MSIGNTLQRVGRSWSRLVNASPFVTRFQAAPDLMQTSRGPIRNALGNIRSLGPSTRYLLQTLYRRTPFSTGAPVSRVVDMGSKTAPTKFFAPYGFSTPLREGTLPLSAQRLFKQQRAWVESIWGPKTAQFPEMKPSASAGPGNPNVLRWSSLIQKVSKESGVPADVLAAIMEIESGGDPNAVSPAGAVGLMQIMPQYHAQRAYRYGGPLTDPYVNLRVAAEILAENYAKYGDWDKAAAAYFGAIDASGRITNASDGLTTGIQYVQKFRENRKKYLFLSGEKVPVSTVTGGQTYPITQGYWTRENPSWYPSTGGYHPGIDLAVPLRTPLYAPYTGKVVHAGELDGYGLAVMIDTGFGYLLLGHLDSIVVKPGQVVGVGDALGLSGSSGFSTGPHLHIEMRDYQGRFIDPALYLAF